jgi:hypothetical protein
MDKHEPFDVLVARLGFTRAVQQVVDKSFANGNQRTQELIGNRQSPPEKVPATIWDDELDYSGKVKGLETLGNKKRANDPGLHLVKQMNLLTVTDE